MAYFDRDDDFLVWLAEPLPDDVLTASRIHLMEMEREPEADVTDSDPACGYIVRDWFGPFLFSPSGRCSRGRC
jgi:hypothetical protein